MRFFPLTVALAAAALVSPTSSRAQSLAEAAAKEKERRKATSARTFTEEDLRRAGANRQREAPTAAEGAAAPAEAAAPKDAKQGKEGAPKPKTEDEVRAEKEKAWRDRLTKANEDVSKLTGQVDTMQRALNDASQNLYGQGRASQVARLEEAKGQLATAQRSVADLQEEGRRSSYRP